MEEKYLFRKLLDEYPDMEEVLKSWFISYFDDNHPENYLPMNQHLLHPKPTIEIRDWDIVVQSNKTNGTTTHVNSHWASSIIEGFIFDTANIHISYKPISMVQRIPRYLKGKVKWKIYKGTELIRKGLGEFDLFQDLSAEIFFPNAFGIISEEIKKEVV